MKRKALLMLGLVVALGSTSIMGAFAAEGQGATSTGTVGFDNENGEGGGGEETTPPVDPEYPDENIDPDDKDDEDGGSTGNDGQLRIDYVSNFKFGTYKIGSGTQTLYAKPVGATDKDNNRIEVPNYAQVSDLRGSGAGWRLSVAQDDQFKTEEGRALTGATLKLSNITASTNNEDGPVAMPEGYSVTLTPGGQASLVMRAAEENGYGTHVAHFGNTRLDETGKKSVSLEIPGSTTILEKEYTTKLTWTLSDTPGDNYGGLGIGIDIEDPNEFEEGVSI